MSVAAPKLQSRSLAALPMPPGRPLVGHLLEAWDNPLKLFTKGTALCGDIVRFRFAWLDYVLVSDPDAVRHILVENAKNYHKSPNYAGLKVMLGDGLLTSEGDDWKRQRRLTQPAFHREKIAGFVQTMGRCTEDMLDRWAEGELDVHAEMNQLTLRIVGLTLLSTDLEKDAQSFGDALGVAIKWANEHVESVVRLPPWVPTPNNYRFRKAQNLIESIVKRVVAERRAQTTQHNDLLGMLMEARDEETGDAMSDEQLLHELLTLTLAGHETTANGLAFTFYLLSRHPEIMRKLGAEVDQVLGGRTPSMADIVKLPYVRAVVDESLRLYPPAWVFERIALEDDQLGDLPLPKGTIVGISPYAMHRHPRYYPNPEGFDPDRFLAGGSMSEGRHKHAYLPFGGGSRTCIGNTFALTELVLIVAMVAQRFHLDLAPASELELDASVTLRPKNGLRMRLRRRSSVRAAAS